MGVAGIEAGGVSSTVAGAGSIGAAGSSNDGVVGVVAGGGVIGVSDSVAAAGGVVDGAGVGTGSTWGGDTDGAVGSVVDDSLAVGSAGVVGTVGRPSHVAIGSPQGTTTQCDSHAGTSMQAAGKQLFRFRSLSMHLPARTGLKVVSVHKVATVAKRTQYVNGLDMEPDS
jgi:hypothetical protein